MVFDNNNNNNNNNNNHNNNNSLIFRQAVSSFSLPFPALSLVDNVCLQVCLQVGMST